MIKHFCDSCEKEIKGKEINPLTTTDRLEPFELCGECLGNYYVKRSEITDKWHKEMTKLDNKIKSKIKKYDS
jgi:hypothetical protein